MKWQHDSKILCQSLSVSPSVPYLNDLHINDIPALSDVPENSAVDAESTQKESDTTETKFKGNVYMKLTPCTFL